MKTTAWVMALIGSICLLSFAPHAQAVGYKMPIGFPVFTNTVTETLTNFPVLVVLSNNVGQSGFNYTTKPFLSANGYDLRFVVNDGDSGSLNYEIEKWDPSGTSYVWVQVPALTNDGLGRIIVKWGEDATQLDCTTNGAVWDSRFRGVWHLTNGVTLSARDSTTNRLHGTINSTYAKATNGVIDGAGIFVTPGTANATRIDLPQIYNQATQGSVSAWVNVNSATAQRQIFNGAQGATPAVRLYFFVTSASKLAYSLGTFTGVTAGTVLSSQTWYYATLTWNGSDARIYLNGKQDGSGSASAAGNAYAAIGAYWQASQHETPFDGGIDEVRAVKVPVSSNWVWACWMNQGSNLTFNSYGTVEALAAQYAPVISSSAATNVTKTSACLNGSLSDVGGSETAVYLYWGPGADQGASGATWAHTGFLGNASSPMDYSTNVVDLTPGTTNSYRYYAINTTGPTWSDPQSYSTLIEPAVTNGVGYTELGMFSVRLNGQVTQGYPLPRAVICWGDNDAGNTSTSDWDHVIDMGTPGVGVAFSNLVTGLTHSTAYFYRCYATNASGGAWATETFSFTTMTVVAPAVTNGVGVTELGLFSARLNGQVTQGNPAPQAYICWGDNDAGNTSTSDWDHVINMGTPSGTFSSLATGLTHNTPYYYRCYVTNISGGAWATETVSFTTQTAVAPAVTNGVGVTELTQFAARLNGQVTQGDPTPQTYICFGDNDAGNTDTGTWDRVIATGATSGAFSNLVVGLSPGSTYYYRSYVVNLLGGAWAASTVSFSTLSAPTGYQMPISFPWYNNGLDTLTNFPVLVVLSNNVGQSGFNYSGFLSTNGYDLRFYRDRTDVMGLNYEIEKWDTNGASYVWVQVPELTSDGLCSILAKWGQDPTQLPCTTNGATWDSRFRGVWHLKNGTTLSAVDSTPNRLNGDIRGAVTATNGVIEGAARLNGINAEFSNQIRLPQIYNGNTQGSVSGWFNIDGPNGAGPGQMIFQGGAFPNRCYLRVNYSTMKFYGTMNDPAADTVGATTISVKTWYYGTMTWNGSVAKVYLNGALDGTGTGAAAGNTTAAIGAHTDGDTTLNGGIDEVRAMNIDVSSNWVWACWLNQSPNGTPNTYGTAQRSNPSTMIILM